MTTKEAAAAALREADHWNRELTGLYCAAVGRTLDAARESWILGRLDRAISEALRACAAADEPAWVLSDLQRMRADCRFWADYEAV